MKIINLIKNKIKKIAAKIAGQPPAPNFATVTVYKNGQQIFEIESTSPNITDGFCTLIQLFSKFNDYKIIFDYINRDIYIYFTVKKAQDVEQVDDGKKSKKEEN